MTTLADLALREASGALTDTDIDLLISLVIKPMVDLVDELADYPVQQERVRKAVGVLKGEIA